MQLPVAAERRRADLLPFFLFCFLISSSPLTANAWWTIVSFLARFCLKGNTRRYYCISATLTTVPRSSQVGVDLLSNPQ